MEPARDSIVPSSSPLDLVAGNLNKAPQVARSVVPFVRSSLAATQTAARATAPLLQQGVGLKAAADGIMDGMARTAKATYQATMKDVPGLGRDINSVWNIGKLADLNPGRALQRLAANPGAQEVAWEFGTSTAFELSGAPEPMSVSTTFRGLYLNIVGDAIGKKANSGLGFVGRFWSTPSTSGRNTTPSAPSVVGQDY
jgi:hypothetical protein